MADQTTDGLTPDTENELVETAKRALSSCNWTVGECAAEWTQRYASGRTDADFGALIGMPGDQVCQRRRVWEVFHDCDTYHSLSWSHHYVSIGWEDVGECLAWSADNDATVAEMKAFRRMQHGEDLTVPAADDMPDIWSSQPATSDDVTASTSAAITTASEQGNSEQAPEYVPFSGSASEPARDTDRLSDDEQRGRKIRTLLLRLAGTVRELVRLDAIDAARSQLHELESDLAQEIPLERIGMAANQITEAIAATREAA